MTYALCVCVREGLVCLADGQITSGNQVSSARKATLHGPEGAQFVVMTSGLRSLRDKTLAYMNRRLNRVDSEQVPTLLDAVDTYASCLRQTAQEDKAAVEASKLTFNLHAIIAGKLPEDPRPVAYLVYPEANWIEVTERTPYFAIGASGYGKPILDRTVAYDTTLRMALKAAYLSFDSTRVSATDVGYPVDVMTLAASDGQWRTATYAHDDLREQREWWNRHLTQMAAQLPDEAWSGQLLPADAASRSSLSSVRDGDAASGNPAASRD